MNLYLYVWLINRSRSTFVRKLIIYFDIFFDFSIVHLATTVYEFATLWTATNENKSSVANALSNHPLLSLFRSHVSSSTNGWLTGVREKLNAATISVTRHVQRIVSSYSSRIFSFAIFARILVIAYSRRTWEMRRAREFGIDDSSPSRLRLNWISSRSINGRMETNSRCSISRMLPSGLELEAYNPIFN